MTVSPSVPCVSLARVCERKGAERVCARSHFVFGPPPLTGHLSGEDTLGQRTIALPSRRHLYYELRCRSLQHGCEFSKLGVQPHIVISLAGTPG
eukprot:5255122-Pleurochrysis_carterae.AAC.1